MTTNDSPTARSKLLTAAAEEFADKGIAGSRVDAIAARAGVNKQLLYYYFGSKDGLFRALLQLRLARPKSVPADEDPSTGERMAKAARRHLDDQNYIRLLMWEALDSSSDAEMAEEEERRAFYGELIERIRQAQAEGSIPSDLDPTQILLTRIAQLMFPVAFPQITRLVTGLSVDDPEFAEARATYLRRVYDGTDRDRSRT